MTPDKERTMLYYRQLRRAAALSRFLLEVAAIALISWSSDRLSAALAVCAPLFRRLPAVLFHPASAFLLGNVIIVVLFAKSGGYSEEDTSSHPPPSQFTSGDVQDPHRYCSYFSVAPPPQLHQGEEEEVIVYEDKAVCMESTTATAVASATSFYSVTAAAATSPKKCSQRGLLLTRTRSCRLPVAATKVSGRKMLLWRSETDVGARRSVGEQWCREEEEAEEGDGGWRRGAAEDDDVDEFRRRIEAFILKQRYFEREEESLLLAAKGAGTVVVANDRQHQHSRR